MSHFTLQDFTGSLVAVLAFAFLLFSPGYVLAYAFDLCNFRKQSVLERLSWSVSCSLAVVPILSYLTGRFTGIDALCHFFEILSLCVAIQLLRERPRLLLSRTESLTISAVLCAWICFAIASLIDLQFGHKLYFSVIQFDQSYRVAFTDAVLRTGVPPANPMYFPGHAEPMRYYYFWYVECAMVARLAHVSARDAFIASSVWTGIALCSLIGLCVRYFLGVQLAVRRHIYVAVGLLLVTGADLLPAIGSIFSQTALNGEMEWWSIDQFSSWQDSLLWVPHHVAALCCCVFSFLLLWRTREGGSKRQRGIAIVVSAASFASAVGLSVYVAFGFAVLMGCWIARLLMQRTRDLTHCARILIAGAISALLLAPFLRELLRDQGSGESSTGKVFSFSIRRMIDPELLTGLPVFSSLHQAHPLLLDTIMRLLLLLPGLCLELGFYGMVLVLFWLARRRTRADEAIDTALYLGLCGLILVSFVRSSVISNNDFAYRASLLPQFFLLLLGSGLLASWLWSDDRSQLVPWTRTKARCLYGLLLLGLAGTAYQVVMLRVFMPLEEYIAGTGFHDLPEEAYEARAAFAQFDRIALRSAVVEFNPSAPEPDKRGDVVSPRTFYVRSLLMYSNRQVAQAEAACATEFGGSPGSCAELKQSTEKLYGAAVPSAAFALAYCQRYAIGYLVVTQDDAAWGDAKGWGRTLPSVVQQPGLHILYCAAPGIAYDGPNSLITKQ